MQWCKQCDRPLKECPVECHTTYQDEQDFYRYHCGTCGQGSDEYMQEYYSLGVYAGRYCSESCWKASGYRDEPASAFDPMDAGEHYSEEDY